MFVDPDSALGLELRDFAFVDAADSVPRFGGIAAPELFGRLRLLLDDEEGVIDIFQLHIGELELLRNDLLGFAPAGVGCRKRFVTIVLEQLLFGENLAQGVIAHPFEFRFAGGGEHSAVATDQFRETEIFLPDALGQPHLLFRGDGGVAAYGIEFPQNRRIVL